MCNGPKERTETAGNFKQCTEINFENEELRGHCRKLHNEELNLLDYKSPDVAIWLLKQLRIWEVACFKSVLPVSLKPTSYVMHQQF